MRPCVENVRQVSTGRPYLEMEKLRLAQRQIQGLSVSVLRYLVYSLRAGTAGLIQRPVLLTASHKGLHRSASDELGQDTV